ncbi:MAG TPA: helix-turn-helix domain-containing protein [Firmicutes bacterium]|nr:helix-turn-helix domain-containing protein [Bacillota bacterium]
MYNIYGFGRRIASFRKLAGLTQEELAERLNITAQAVSKWENEICFPEITMLPRLAQELNTTIEKLFGGGIDPTKAEASAIPKQKGRLKLIHTYQGLLCYSDKEVAVTNEDTVVFKDGSSADLRRQEIINKGSGEICFDFADEYDENDQGQTELSEVFSGIASLRLEISNATFQVLRSPDTYTRLKAVGSAPFIGGLQVSQSGSLLAAVQKQQNYHRGERNRIEIMIGQDSGSDLELRIGGSGSGEVQVPFKNGLVQIGGSGDVILTDFDVLKCRISGSGDLKADKIGEAELAISGAGNVELNEVTIRFEAHVSGAGDISVSGGNIDEFKAEISGAGDIKAQGLTARTADITCHGASDVVLGRVIEGSKEKHSQHSSIKILQRG